MSNFSKILIVDDEPGIRKSLIRNLHRQFKNSKDEFEIREAANGEECIRMAKEDRPDLILLDIRMPIMDGMQACRILRNDPSFDPTVIIILTAEATAEVTGLSNGADDYVTKPYDVNALLMRVEHGLKTAHQRGFVLMDADTGLWTKGYFENCRINAEVNRAKRHEHHLCLLVIRLGLNNNDNNPVGLSHYTDCLMSREYDVKVRWNENSFALLLPETNDHNAILVAHKLIKSLHDSDKNLPISIGIAHFNPFDESPCEALIPFAETSMAVSHDTGFIAVNGCSIPEASRL